MNMNENHRLMIQGKLIQQHCNLNELEMFKSGASSGNTVQIFLGMVKVYDHGQDMMILKT